MIALPAPPLATAVAARRIGAGRLPCWLASPGAGQLAIAREYLACDPVAVVRAAGPADVAGLDELMAAWRQARQRWQGGPEIPVGIGYLSYDLGRGLLGRGLRSQPPPGDAGAAWPTIEFRFYDALLVYQRGIDSAEIWASDDRAAHALHDRLSVPAAGEPAPLPFTLGPFQPTEPDDRHLQAVERVRRYLVAGDAYQVNLARRLRAHHHAPGPPGLALYTRLAQEAPAAHGLWLADVDADGGAGRALIGNSPEWFLRLGTDRWIATEPIKGTRPRGSGADDQASAQHLIGDPKDHAEHVMIVDLERNDLGRVCATGSVEVSDRLRLLPLPSVFHLVSTVRGRLRDGVELPDILRACFPGGSITGAPKLRAMEIIDELEAAPRGPYTGATGWLGAAGDFDLAIAIRTALLIGQALTLWVGGGVVIDSTAQAELDETVVKARAFARLTNDTHT